MKPMPEEGLQKRKGKEVLAGEPRKKKLASYPLKTGSALKIVGQADPSPMTPHRSPQPSAAVGPTSPPPKLTERSV